MTGRLPPRTQLGRVRLQVADLERSLDYYTRVLGLAVLTRTDRKAGLGAHGRDAPLVELNERAGARPVPRGGRLGLYHFAILLPDRASLGRFLLHLTSVGARPSMADHAVSESLYLWDPDGLGIEVYADRPRSMWQYDGQEVHLTVDPLNVESLATAAGAGRWSGMPAGTVMGHVHLHVGDLDEASTFYSDGVGFDRTAWSLPGALFLAAGGYHHHLGTNTWAAGAPPASDDDARLLDWEIIVPTPADAAAAGQRLQAAGYSATADNGVLRATDPWGLAVKIRAS